MLRLVTDGELPGFAAHELAHECFIGELRQADRMNSTHAYHLVKSKSDLVAALACLMMKCDPLATVTGLATLKMFYRKFPAPLATRTPPRPLPICCVRGG